MLGTSVGLINRDLIYITSPTKKNWAIRSQQDHTEGFLYQLTSHNSLPNSSAFLDLKQIVKIKVFFINT